MLVKLSCINLPPLKQVTYDTDTHLCWDMEIGKIACWWIHSDSLVCEVPDDF